MATPDGKSAQPTADQLGEKMKALVEGAPETMAELMRAFIMHRDLNMRVKIRLRMKALLDLVAVDTVYPKVPSRDMPQPGRPGFAQPMMGPARQLDLGGELDRRVVGGMEQGEVAPIPGADPVPDNGDVLG